MNTIIQAPYCPAVWVRLNHSVPQLPRRRSDALAELAMSRRQLEIASIGGTIHGLVRGHGSVRMARTAIERASAKSSIGSGDFNFGDSMLSRDSGRVPRRAPNGLRF